MMYIYVYMESEKVREVKNVSEPTTGTLAKRKFIFELGVGGPDQDVINKLERAKVYRDLIVRAVRQYREEDSSDGNKGT